MNCKHLLIAVITLCSLSASAQVSKGSLFLGGNVHFSTQNNEDSKFKNTSVGISPAVGKAVRQNLVAGIDLNYTHQQTKSNDTLTTTDEYIGAGFFLRKYVELGKGFYLFGQARAGGYYFKSTNDHQYTNDGKGYSVGVSAYPGISYEINRKFHIEAGLANLFYLNYANTRYTRPDATTYKNSSFSIGTALSTGASLSLGLRLIIAPKGA